MQHIFILDYFLLPLYFAFFIWRVRIMAKKPEASELKKYLFIAFALRMFGSVAYSMVIEYYYGYGDSFTFYDGGTFFTELISKSPSNIYYLFAPFKETSELYNSSTVASGYFDTPSNNMVMRISGILSYLSFNKYLIIGLFFGFFSLAGQWKLFLVFDDINNHRNRNLLALGILFSPSIWFWGSGLNKDSICLGSLGFIIHIFYQFFIKKKFSLLNAISLVLLIYLVTIIKFYITVIIAIGIAVMIFSLFLQSIKNVVLRVSMILFSILIIGIILYNSDFSTVISEMAEESTTQIKAFQENYQLLQDTDDRSKAGFDLGEMDPSFTSLLLKSPWVVFTCLFRPFLWESKKVIIFFTSLESTLLLICTLFVMIKLGIIHFFRTILTTPYLLFCFTISILFALIIGFTTFNFGTMIRYKIIFLPFYYFLLINLYCNYKRVPNRVFSV